jgi:hypothetical protein
VVEKEISAMKIKQSTVYLVLAALVLGGISLIVMQQPAPNKASQSGEVATSEEERRIFEFEEGDVQALTLTTPLRTLKFERDKDGKWQMLEPEKTAASDPSIAFLLDLVATGKTQRTLTIPAADREQYGLHQPLATIDVTLKDQKKHQLVLGEYDFNRSYLYAQADPPPPSLTPEQNPSNSANSATIDVLLVSPNFEDAVSRPLAEWKQPATAEKSASPAANSESPATTPEDTEDATPDDSADNTTEDSPATPTDSPEAESSSEQQSAPAGN